jgi:single-stranded DNA-binding protein
VHLNSVQVIGRVGKAGPKLQYASSGAASATFTLEVDEPSKSGETFTLFLPVEIWGQAERAVELLDPGDEVMLSGRLKYKSHVDAKTQQKVSKLILSSWGIQARQPATTSPDAVPNSTSEDAACNLEQSGEPDARPKRKPRYGKHLQREWSPEHAN